MLEPPHTDRCEAPLASGAPPPTAGLFFAFDPSHACKAKSLGRIVPCELIRQNGRLAISPRPTFNDDTVNSKPNALTHGIDRMRRSPCSMKTKTAIRIVIAGLLALSAAASAGAATKPKDYDGVWYERIEAGCKADAKRYYSAIHFKKRGMFVKQCIDRAYR